jgi:hypothetical protein
LPGPARHRSSDWSAVSFTDRMSTRYCPGSLPDHARPTRCQRRPPLPPPSLAIHSRRTTSTSSRQPKTTPSTRCRFAACHTRPQPIRAYPWQAPITINSYYRKITGASSAGQRQPRSGLFASYKIVIHVQQGKNVHGNICNHSVPCGNRRPSHHTIACGKRLALARRTEQTGDRVPRSRWPTDQDRKSR